jgi:subtilisin family serine protease
VRAARRAAAAVLGLLAPAAAAGAETPWELRLEPGRHAPTTVTVENRCATPQRYSVSLETAVPWLRLDRPRLEREVPAASNRSAGAVVDTRGLEPGFYAARVAVECVTCAADPSCRQDRDVFVARLHVPWTPAAIAGFDEDDTVVPGELLAVLAAERAEGVLGDLESEGGLRVVRSFPLASIGGILAVVRRDDPAALRPDDPDGPAAALERLQGLAGVLWAQPSFRYRTLAGEAVASDPLAGAQYAARMLRAGEAHRLATGRGVRVAIVDSGVAADHPDLAGRVAAGATFLPGRERPAPHRHGTAVAGLIGAGRGNGVGIVGIAPEAELIGLEACSGESEEIASCTTETVARAVDAAVGSGARVINSSVGGPRDPLLARLAREAFRRRVVLVAAAGNDGPAGGVAYPAALPEVVAVTAVDAEERPWAAAARGAAIDCAAPGVEVLSTVPGGGFHPLTGTSMAAAHVAALAALALEVDPGLGPGELRGHLRASAVDRGAPGFDEVFGYGRVDACALLARIAGDPGLCPSAGSPAGAGTAD